MRSHAVCLLLLGVMLLSCAKIPFAIPTSGQGLSNTTPNAEAAADAKTKSGSASAFQDAGNKYAVCGQDGNIIALATTKDGNSRDADSSVYTVLPSREGPFVDIAPPLRTQAYSTKSPTPTYSPPLPRSGPESVIVLLVEFTDLPSTRTSGSITTQVFTTMDGYYREVSYDQTWLTGDTAGWFLLAHDRAYYGEDWSGYIDDPNHDGYSESWWLIRDAVAVADPLVDFSLYNHVMVVHAGNGQESSGVANDVWSVRWSGISISTNDGVTITEATIVPEFEMGIAESTLGVMAHEFGHDLGLPDLYHYGHVGEDDFVDQWCLMAAGGWNGNPQGSSPAHPMAYCKIMLGWTSNIVDFAYDSHGGGYCYPQETYTLNTQVIRIAVAPSQYYLVEMRSSYGYDAYLPSTGVLISYCDETLGNGQGIVKVRDAHPGTTTLDDAAYQSRESFISGSLHIDVHAVYSNEAYITVMWKTEKWIADQPVTSSSEVERNPDIASDSSGNLYVANEMWYPSWSHYIIGIQRSTDGGRTWTVLVLFGSLSYDWINPCVAVDVGYFNTVYVICEQVVTSINHNIVGFAYNSTGYRFMSIDTDTEFHINPCVTCEYQYGSYNYIYVAYERIMSYDDRDMVVQRSTDHGRSWTLVLQLGTLDFNVYCDLSITCTEGSNGYPYVYVAYKYGLDYASGFWIGVVFSTNFGTSWSQVWACTESIREKHYTSIAAGRSSGTVVVAWHVYYDGTWLEDIEYAYSFDNGASYALGWLAASFNSETYVDLSVDGQGESTSYPDCPYFHAIYRVGNNVMYRRAAVNRPNYWSPEETVNTGSLASQIYLKASVTGTIRPGNVRYPVIVWTDIRGSYDIYYSTRGGVATFLTQPAGLNVLVGIIPYSTPVSFEWIAGMLTSFTAPLIQNGPTGVRYVFNNWTGGWMGGYWQGGSSYAQNVSWMCDPYDVTITAYYDTEYYLTVSSAYGTTTGEGWYPSGSTVYAGLTADIVPGGTGERFVFQSWGGDASGSYYWQSDAITMTGPKTATANWQTEYYLTVTSTYGTPSGTGWYAEGTTAYAALDTDLVGGAPGERFVFASWGNDASGTGYAQSDPIIMSAPKTAVANWQTQYYLTVSSAYGTSSGQGWYDEGTTVYASLSAAIVPGGTGTRYVFLSWAGDASGSNYAQSNPIIMTGPKTATANWQTQHYLTVSSAYATPSGAGWYAEGTTAYASLDTGIVAGSTGQRFVFLSWTGDATGTNYAWSDPITMSGPKAATANWQTQYYLTVASSHGTPTGQGWYAVGQIAYASLDASIVPGATGTRYVFVNWTGDASGSNYAQSNPITMSGPKAATANWQTQYYVTVTSARGAPTSSAWVNAQADFDASVTSPTDIVADTSRWVCSGHRVDGGSLNSSIVCNLTNVVALHTIAFEWIEQFHLTTRISPADLTPLPTVAPAGEWFNNGTSVTLTGSIVTGYVFDHWAVDGVAQETGRNPVQVVMDAAHLAIAYYNQAPSPVIPALVIGVVLVAAIAAVAVGLVLRSRGPHRIRPARAKS